MYVDAPDHDPIPESLVPESLASLSLSKLSPALLCSALLCCDLPHLAHPAHPTSPLHFGTPQPVSYWATTLNLERWNTEYSLAKHQVISYFVL